MDDLTNKLQVVVAELEEIMNQRHEHVAELKAEIARIEMENEHLEKQVQDLLKSF